MHLLSATTFDSGVALLSYRPIPDAASPRALPGG
jgi:hypothetical protein